MEEEGGCFDGGGGGCYDGGGGGCFDGGGRVLRWRKRVL